MQANEAILIYDSATRSESKATKISISSHEFLIGSKSISTDFIIGVNHIKINSKFPFCCSSSANTLQKLAASVSQEATLYWRLAYLERFQNQRGETLEPKLHFLNFKSENIAMASHIVNDARRFLGYLNNGKCVHKLTQVQE
jgi:hypothetical protein